MEEATTAAATNSEILNSLKRKLDDIGWNYGTIADPINKDKIKCNFCDHVSTGGIYRLKHTLVTLEILLGLAKKPHQKLSKLAKALSREQQKRRRRSSCVNKV
ncbi:hypothetical protein LINPERPRIM_LOCUS21623 [Linum perenne]